MWNDINYLFRWREQAKETRKWAERFFSRFEGRVHFNCVCVCFEPQNDLILCAHLCAVSKIDMQFEIFRPYLEFLYSFDYGNLCCEPFVCSFCLVRERLRDYASAHSDSAHK